ncbi:MAG: glycine--tRNA ligase subunit alpha [Candidatus Eisenbacteria bacterium]|uniref:Glycine--tRNA ligase alpha subunit n=1 Tax=Eiseniibacteriota bacterium TaxID=2212470 RepID=A0A538U607_UNCEI|nr:MAG: glycine--tRNA ligase subunit alpha [Candidatus Eisenbacteria bacterium]
MVVALETYWSERGCVIQQPYPSEVGAGTFNPATFLRSLGPEPWKVAYVEPSRRPKDGRYGENPNRFQQFYQYQVLLKPSPPDVVDQYFDSLRMIGIDLTEHDLRLVEDDWESPTLGAAGLGWQVWMDGTEISQFTYFQQAGGLEVDIVSAELTYGLDRIGMMLQGKDRVQELVWCAGERGADGAALGPAITWADLWLQNEKEFSRYNFEEADVAGHFAMFTFWEKEANRFLDMDPALVNPGYDAVIKTSHLFNVLDARGAISVSERVGYIARVRKLARKAAEAYVEQRAALGFPMLKDPAEREKWLARKAQADASAAGNGKGAARGAGAPAADSARAAGGGSKERGAG